MIRIDNIKIDVKKDSKERLLSEISKKLNIKKDQIINYKINKKSIDARKEKVYYIYEVDVELDNEQQYSKYPIVPNESYIYQKCNWQDLPPVIVGTGPSGLFCAYTLLKAGCKPIIIERGENIEKRCLSVEKFWQTGILNQESNVQFGCGGAGTFSDGKLTTLKKDKNNRNKEVLRIFHKFGAKKDILYERLPHIGTDYLKIIVDNMIKELTSMGATIMFNTKLTNIEVIDNHIKKIEINNKEWINTNTLVLAIGHSARDTFRMLHEKGLYMENKPFAIGIRIEHDQKWLNSTQYKDYASLLPPATYKLTYHSKDNRGIYSFCMCPGGYVVNASSESERLCINGMSNNDRSSPNSNSAIVVTINENDYGTKLFSGMLLQIELEEKTYKYGGGKIPTQRYEDFILNRKTTKFGSIKPNHKGLSVEANLNEILPPYITNNIKEAIEYFNTKIKGFSNPDALISCIEARTSSPIKIVRDDEYNANIKGIYPCGEGAGYAGGIMTSAVDGIKVAEIIINKK